MQETENIIVVKDLYKYFAGGIHAVDGVSLTVGRGKVIVVIGPSGSGKSTLLRCMNFLEVPSSGEV
jgi:ABC-type histidine transport system ATPase subunit